MTHMVLVLHHDSLKPLLEHGPSLHCNGDYAIANEYLHTAAKGMTSSSPGTGRLLLPFCFLLECLSSRFSMRSSLISSTELLALLRAFSCSALLYIACSSVVRYSRQNEWMMVLCSACTTTMHGLCSGPDLQPIILFPISHSANEVTMTRSTGRCFVWHQTFFTSTRQHRHLFLVYIVSLALTLSETSMANAASHPRRGPPAGVSPGTFVRRSEGCPVLL